LKVAFYDFLSTLS
jgi:hypothetical protein